MISKDNLIKLIQDKFETISEQAAEEFANVFLDLQKKCENSEIVLITDEIGYGIVPADAFYREYRETHGRVCTQIAAEAKEVHRVICGIGTVIKG